MPTVTIQEMTTKEPITLIGKEAGICYGKDPEDVTRAYKRGIDCIKSMHGRTWEFPDVYMIIDGYSARCIREFYTHIGGLPTRLQESTRYVNYKDFDYIIPVSISSNEEACEEYTKHMADVRYLLELFETLGIPKEDSANILPLGMTTKIVVKMNLRTLVDMSHQRLCSRAYWEIRDLMREIMIALQNYSEEWKDLVNSLFEPKCIFLNRCPETNSCGYFDNLQKL